MPSASSTPGGHRRHDDDRPEAAGHLRVGGAELVRGSDAEPHAIDIGLVRQAGIAVFRATGQPARLRGDDGGVLAPARAQGITGTP